VAGRRGAGGGHPLFWQSHTILLGYINGFEVAEFRGVQIECGDIAVCNIFTIVSHA
jgi:hypothetical protein